MYPPGAGQIHEDLVPGLFRAGSADVFILRPHTASIEKKSDHKGHGPDPGAVWGRKCEKSNMPEDRRRRTEDGRQKISKLNRPFATLSQDAKDEKAVLSDRSPRSDKKYNPERTSRFKLFNAVFGQE